MIINLSHCNFFFYTHVIQSTTARCCNIKQFIYLSIYLSIIFLRRFVLSTTVIMDACL